MGSGKKNNRFISIVDRYFSEHGNVYFNLFNSGIVIDLKEFLILMAKIERKKLLKKLISIANFR